jgi:phenylalanyl-tRNA synthetase beta chain
MKVSYKWLSELLPQKLSVDELSVILTSIGLEVEDITSSSKIPGGLKGLLIGKVVTCTKHPNADKLSLTTVDVGNNILLPIVCGAPNVAAGQTVVVATVGTTIYPKSGEPFEIKKAKIRGEASEGMICAEDEIGLGNSHDGIIIIKDEITPGTLASSFYNIPEADYTIEIGLTPNRMDAMSHIGIAKDVCAYLANKNNTQVIQIIPVPHLVENTTSQNPISISIQNADSCKRYIGALLNNVNVAESPEWLQEKLNAIGVRCINNIVDITNYILHETGQPLHAFDAQKIIGNQVIIKNATDSEMFMCLDGVERKLKSNDLMIANTENNMCIAGVYGGAESGVSNNTNSIFLEAAWFDPNTIRSTSMHHNLRTDAAIRFEKGVDISQSRYAFERALALIIEIAGATLSSAINDVYPQIVSSKQVSVSYAYINKLSGANYSKEKIKNILLHLCFGIVNETSDELILNIPFAKPDISKPADIVEEIMRIDGLDNVPFTGRISFALGNKNTSSTRSIKEKVAQCLTNLGCHEIFTNSITNSAYYTQQDELVKMMNSLSAELDVLRPSMLETGLIAVAFNLNRKNTDLKLFEIGKIYKHINGKYIEQEQLNIYLSGNQTTETWQQKSVAISLFDAKGIVLALGNKLGVNITMLESKEVLELKIGKQSLGSLYQVPNSITKQHDIKQAVWHICMDWNTLCAEIKKTITKYTPVSKFQNVTRDLALVINKEINYTDISKQINANKSNLLQSINVFDVFESEQLGANKKQYAIRLTFNDAEKTLTDIEIDTEIKKIMSGLEQKLGASIRA